eukprot:CAMPEP_0197569438 /NCGR_PEP_ID=MMETSP1320-20131121/39011_1 /TAXON_ID=91990 /ORGANISM="Bolidomonas sp., Strain RCC2347" /LENGTH=422 /DNA_ID=CAMNT_0043131799 /DNA_START=175 /DNA_END=1443 /DNA_ORIENTATION=+
MAVKSRRKRSASRSRNVAAVPKAESSDSDMPNYSLPLTLYYYYTYLFSCLLSRSPPPHPTLPTLSRHYIYQLTLPLKLWSSPHYRKGTYSQDMRDNLRNVAVPWTGVPLSAFCYFRITYLLFVALALPALQIARSFVTGDRTRVYSLLGRSLTWCELWRINCNVATLHSHRFGCEAEYGMENKWAFLEACESEGVPVSPTLDLGGVCVKHRNEEGGLGIHFYRSAREGGDWIIQPVLRNAEWVREKVGDDGPLSTFRVMTMSLASTRPSSPAIPSDIVVLSCVFRAGRSHAMTDHDSVLFDVDVSTGVVGPGTTNQNWYKVLRPFAGPLVTSASHASAHPDTGAPVEGEKVPNFEAVKQVCVDAHARLLPHIPMVGFDVVLTDGVEGGVCLLEVNLSCNFFRGSFDEAVWWEGIGKVIEGGV